MTHAVKCGTCWPGMRFAEMCGDGRREAIASRDQVDGEPEWAHLAWEVTSEHRNHPGMWVKSRKCADCTDRLDLVVEPEPHWPENGSRPRWALGDTALDHIKSYRFT